METVEAEREGFVEVLDDPMLASVLVRDIG